ncbi:PemK-like, MazF-like toxin of type II toxin-antitoxin system [Ruminococcus sp. YE71]|uniref:type II toxin-antitoxin system PemK/MazF family toxin n=1 Tax=unclassified Ruminococcus TaxID=2608920 RepID=UPI00088981BC|nr:MULTISPECIES: type II toxin-antitoxin system PemK/MazF family toxin [unclassified Ruminococcus]SDA11497.1 PemK-like, MazF-like toxin of type II toxin-antitoxin system [Ruminococcus sp. YE78]SFW15311.1 PemK-like, MazF-like toxin of type II toxin-antitoxin system [Ruminococcus sp. YE71]
MKHIFTEDILPSRGDIYVADMNTVDSMGHILVHKRRPVIVVQNDLANNHHSSTVTVVPISSDKHGKRLPTHLLLEKNCFMLRQQSIAHAENITTILRSDLRYYISRVDEATMKKLVRLISIQIGA